MIKNYDGRDSFYQWDLDRKVIVSDPTVTEIHFCNKTGDCSLIVEVEEMEIEAHGATATVRVANVPNILLQTSWPIKAYAYCGDCYTKDCATFKVIARSKPDDYVYTETEVKSWEDLARRADEALSMVEEVPAALDGKVDKSSLVTVPKANAVPQYNNYGILQGYTAKVDNDLVNLGLLNTRLSELKVAEDLEKRVQNLEDLVNPQYYAPETYTEVLNEVPLNVCTYAELESIGGNSQKEEISNNLCICDGEYNLNGVSSLMLELTNLEPDTEYYINFIGNFRVFYFDGFDGNDNWENQYQTEKSFIFYSYSDTSKTIYLRSVYEQNGDGEEYMEGIITGIMLCKNSDTDKTYKPRLNKQYLGATKAQELISYGEKTSNNLYSGEQSIICDGVYDKGISLGCLPEGDYYVSIDTSELSNFFTLELRDSNWNNWAEIRYTYTDTILHINDSTSENLLIIGSVGYDSPEPDSSMYLNGIIKNIMLCDNNDTDKTYKPYEKYGKELDKIEIPVEAQNQKGYGLAVDTVNSNRIEFRDDGRIYFVRAFDELDLGNLSWSMSSSYKGTFTCTYGLSKYGIKKYTSSQIPLALCSKYEITTGSNITSRKVDKAISYYNGGNQVIYVRDTSITDLATFKEVINGEKLIFALEKPEEIDITDYFNHDNYLKVLGAKKIEIVTDKDVAVPVSITYLLKGGSV